MTADLQVERLSVGYRSGRRRPRVVLREVTARVAAGELACLVGPNGVGKSTLLRSIAGLQPSFGGRVLLTGEPLDRLSRRQVASRLSAVLTDRFEPGRLRALDVVALGRHPRSGWSGRLDATDHEVIARSLADVGAGHLGDADLGELSDGQRQRVLVARALAQEPRVLLLDEPTAFLDPPGRIALMMLLRRICAERDVAVLVCTHDIESASRYADQLWIADPGGTVSCGAPEDLAYSGLLQASFSQEGIGFDLSSLTFVARDPGAPTASVHGPVAEAHLVGHALRRHGPAPDPGRLPPAEEPSPPGGSLSAGRLPDAVGTVPDRLRVALLHLAPHHARQDANREALLEAVEKAAASGALLVVAPELATSGYCFEDLDAATRAAQTVRGTAVTALGELTRSLGIYCAVGLLERDARTGLLHNTAVLLDPGGQVAARHRKLVLAERRWATPGSPCPDALADTPWGRIGLLVCADSYSGVPARTQALHGADLLLVLANWPPVGIDPRLLWRARALENGVPVIACNRTGVEEGFDCRRASSYAVDCRGEVVLAQTSPEPATFLVDLPLRRGRVEQRRSRALAGRLPGAWGGLGLDTAALPDPSSLWGVPPQHPVEVRLIVPGTPAPGTPAPGTPASGTPASTGDEEPDPRALTPVIEIRAVEEAAADGVVPGLRCRGWPQGLIVVGDGPDGPFLASGDGVEVLGDSPVLMRLVEGCRVAVTTPGYLRHPEAALALAKQGCDLVVALAAVVSEELAAMVASRCVERVPVALATQQEVTAFLPPVGCQAWVSHPQVGPGVRTVSLDVAAGRRRTVFDRLDLETLCSASGT